MSFDRTKFKPEVLLTKEEFPVGSRVIIRHKRFVRQDADVTILEWHQVVIKEHGGSSWWEVKVLYNDQQVEVWHSAESYLPVAVLHPEGVMSVSINSHIPRVEPLVKA